MEEKDFNELMNRIKKEMESSLVDSAEKGKLNEIVKTQIEAATAGIINSDTLAEKFEEFGLGDGVIKELTDAVEKQGQEMQKVLQQKSGQETVEDILEKNKDAIMKVAENPKEGLKLHLPPVRKTLVQTSAVASSTLAMRLPDVGQLPYLGAVMRNSFRNVSVGAGTGGVIRYVDQNAITRAAAPTAEAAQKPESVIDWIERTLTLRKIADSIPVTKEAWTDFGFVQSEIDRLLNTNLALKVDEQIWDGDNTGANLNGLYTLTTAFNAGAYAGTTVAEATLYDLLAILRVEIMNSKQSKYTPDAVFLNPADILKYKLAKGSDGHYVLPPFISADGTRIDMMRVIESSQVTANTMVLGDTRYGTVYTLEGVTIEMGYVNDQFIKNTFTILAEERLGFLVRNVDVDAFLKVTDIDAAIAAVTFTPSV